MKSIVMASSLAVVAASAPDYATLWSKFKSDFGRTYASEGNEEEKRFQVFQANVDTINKANAMNLSYTLGINSFSDLTPDEFVASRTGFKMPKISELYGGAAYLGNHTWNGEDLPSSIDWTTNNAVTPIKNQGACGSCWIFSAIGSLEGAYAIATKNLVSLAEQQVLDCDHSFFPPTLGCHGGSMFPVFGYAEKNALCTTASYPYQAVAGTCAATTCTEGVAKGKFTGWKGLAPVAKVAPASYEAMMSAVAQQPVSVSIEADKDVFHLYKGGVVDGACGQVPDHGVLVVGYGTDPALGDYWKIKNSWGTSWGEDGYVRIKRGGSWRGECAILNSPSYPIVSSGVPDVVV